MIAGRLRDRFGSALQALYVLPDNPYEPTGDDEWLVLAAVLDNAYLEENDASQQASEVGCAFEKEIDWRYVSTIFTLSVAELEENAIEVARMVKNGGVRL